MKSRFIILLMAALIVAAPAETSARKKKAKKEDSKETVRTPYEKLFKDRKGECAEGRLQAHQAYGGPVREDGHFESMSGLISRSVSFRKELAYLDGIKAFEDNVSVKSVLTYTSDMKILGTLTLYKDKPTTAKMTRTFLLLPEKPMRPRIADSRIGTFFWGVEHFSDEDEVKALYYANHWDIYPSDVEAYRRGELVEPVKPVVFYVDSAFPEDDPEFDPDNLRK